MIALRRGFWIVLVSAFLLSACGLQTISGSGNIVSESRPVSGFDSVTLAGSGDVIITQGDSESLTVEADDNLMSYIRSEVRGGTLTLGEDDDGWWTNLEPSRPIRYIVTLKDLTAMTLSGSGSMDVASLHTETLDITLSGSGKVLVGSLDAGQLAATLSGSGRVGISGQVPGQKVSLDGSASYEAGDLESESAQIGISGSGNATVWAHTDLKISISGSGTVSYYDLPAVTMEGSGSGKVVSLGSK